MPEPLTDTTAALHTWAAQQLGNAAIELQALSGDAGFRRYFRVSVPIPEPVEGEPVKGVEKMMAVLAPPATENTPLYLTVSHLLTQGGVRVPRVLATDIERGFLLVEDCGDQLLLPALTAQNADTLYSLAQQQMLAMQAIAVPTGTLGLYDRDRLWDEMALFPQWFVQDLLQLPFGRAEHHLLDHLFQWLINSALEQPQGFVHRDYHARNLMLHPTKDGHDELVTIDFQDALIGPCTYDLVSLLRDCYVRWPPEQVNAWALSYRQKLLAANRPAGDSDAQFLRWLDLMGLQRHIKVLGIFARLYLRDGKAGYLNDLPLVLRYTLEVAARYPEAAEFVDWMEVRVLPACRRQKWFQAWD